jgi:hypothetical protein
MLLALVARTLVAGAYLVALLFHGTFNVVATLVGLAMVLIWAAPLLRDRIRRRRADQVLKTTPAMPIRGL